MGVMCKQNWQSPHAASCDRATQAHAGRACWLWQHMCSVEASSLELVWFERCVHGRTMRMASLTTTSPMALGGEGLAFELGSDEDEDEAMPMLCAPLTCCTETSAIVALELEQGLELSAGLFETVSQPPC